MATKTKTAAKKGIKPNVAKKVNTSLLNVSIAAINTTLDNGEKWQKLASKLIKKSEKVREQQINMIFDTAETVKGQFMVGADKMKDLVGYDTELVEKAKAKLTNNPVSRKVVGMVEEITEKVTENPMVQKAEKATEDMKTKGKAKFNELKGDVLKQASKVVNKAEAMLEDAQTTPKAKATKKVTAKKTVAKKAVATKAKATKTVTKATPKKVVVKKAANVEAKATAKVKAVKAEVKTTIKTAVKDDLKLIYGIGPKTEITLNNNGVKTYADLAKLETAEVEAILDKAGTIFSKTEAKDWKKQAEVAVKDGAEGLAKWVERYRTA